MMTRSAIRTGGHATQPSVTRATIEEVDHEPEQPGPAEPSANQAGESGAPDNDDVDHAAPLHPSESPDMTGNIASALSALAASIGASKKPSSRTRTREPDTFDGSEPRKLQSFLVQCQLNFRDRPEAFSSDDAKVTYALSYLKGTALDWFEPALENPSDEPDWFSDYDEFVAELKANFGPYDPEGEAEAELESLRMRETQHATRYLVEFNKLAARVQWGDAALRRQLYRGLPARIKGEISRVGKPETLTAFRTLIQNIDTRY